MGGFIWEDLCWAAQMTGRIDGAKSNPTFGQLSLTQSGSDADSVVVNRMLPSLVQYVVVRSTPHLIPTHAHNHLDG